MMTKIFENRGRFLMGFLMFLCIFSKNLINTNVLFALDGMVNHTYVNSGMTKMNASHRNCTKEQNSSIHQNAVTDGPFPWDDKIEALVNSMVSVGYIVGTLISLISYDYLRARFVFAILKPVL